MNITNRTTHDVQQGTGAWLRLREGFSTASEAPAALGVSKYVTRAELLRVKHTGVAAEHSPATLGKFAAGHDAEARARPLAEPIVGGELFPVTMSAIVDGLPLLASLDGMTLDDTAIWETKLWNEELAAAVQAAADGSALPEHYKVQMDQELLVSGAEVCLFSCTDGTPERFVCCRYEANPARFQALVEGWRQFHADLAAYVLQPNAEPAPVVPVETLPAVSVRMDGALAVQSNLPAFGLALREFVGRVPKRPSNDLEFAQTEAACKALKRAEEALDAAEANALASLTDVDAMRRMVAEFRDLARATRLASEKMVDRRKLEIREEAVMAARKALDAHITTLNGELQPFRVPQPVADFAGAIKGKRSIASMQDALDGVLTVSKIAAEADARAMRKNIEHFKEVATGLESLFADLGQLVLKPAEDFRMLVQARVLAQQERDRKAEEARKAAEAERIAAAEQRAREQEAARIAAQQAEDARVAALAAQREQDAAAEAVRVAATVPTPTARAAERVGAMISGAVQQAAVLHPQTVAPPPAAPEPATLSLGDICRRLGFTVTFQFLADTLRVAPAKTQGASKLYTERQFAHVCAALQTHIAKVYEAQREAVEA